MSAGLGRSSSCGHAERLRPADGGRRTGAASACHQEATPSQWLPTSARAGSSKAARLFAVSSCVQHAPGAPGLGRPPRRQRDRRRGRARCPSGHWHSSNQHNNGIIEIGTMNLRFDSHPSRVNCTLLNFSLVRERATFPVEQCVKNALQLDVGSGDEGIGDD